MADLKISELPQLLPGQLNATDPLALADLSASTTKRISAVDLIRDGISLLPTGAIPGDKVTLSIPDGSITTAKLADGGVTAAKLAANSTTVVGAGVPAAGAFIGQFAVDTSTTPSTSYVWTGVGWVATSGLTSATGSITGLLNTYVATTAGAVTISADLDATTAAGQFLAGPAGAGGAIAARRIDPQDLPTAGAAKGAVAVNGRGLAMAGDVVGIANAVTANAGTGHLVTYDANGLVTGGAKITPPDLPVATNANIGAVRPDADLTVNASGTLTHTNSVVAATATKVSYDANGHVTNALPLLETDIPDLPASRIVSGTFTGARIADQSITAAKLADYAIAYIQEAVPPAGVGSHPIGMTWLQESTGQVSIWNGNSWMKTGASTLFNKNLRYCGTYDATTGKITGVTQFGTAEGFKVGDAIPAADDQHAGCYFVASTGGTNASIASGAVFDAGDWLLCQGTTGGWVRIDTLNGSGGGSGGGASNLDDLLDVTITTPKPGDVLHFTAAGQWVNVPFLEAGTY